MTKEQLKVGMRINYTGGLIGTIKAIKGNTFVIKWDTYNSDSEYNVNLLDSYEPYIPNDLS